MNNVSWYDAVAYCNWLSDQEGIHDPRDWCYEPNDNGEYAEGIKIPADWQQRKGYRLPAGTEWEYVCRTNCTAQYSYGEPIDLLGRYAWYQVNSLDRKGRLFLSPIGSLRPNAFGVFDMHGHVWELVPRR